MNSARVAGYSLGAFAALCLAASLRLEQPTLLSTGAAVVGGVALQELLFRRAQVDGISRRGARALFAASPVTWILLWGAFRLPGIFMVMFGGMMIGMLGFAIRYRPPPAMAAAAPSTGAHVPSQELADRVAQYNRLRNRAALRVTIGFALVGAIEWLVGIKMVWVPENWVAVLGAPVLLGLVCWAWVQLRDAARSTGLICRSCRCNVAKWGRRVVVAGVCPRCRTPLGAN